MFRPAAALVCAALITTASLASAEPILKPHKYYGPIPQSALFLRVGMLGGATDQEMLDFLDSRTQPPFENNIEDFGNSLTFDIGYQHKPHPRFGFRLNASYSGLKATDNGNMVALAAPVPPDTVSPELDFSREFKVDLFVLEASAVYYFADASVKEFQTYLGGGFSFGFPYQTYTDTRVRADNGQPFGEPIDLSEWDFSAGVHAVLGAIYYVSNRFGISGEGRVQLMESNFDQIEIPNETGDPETVGFVVKYTGFFVTVGVLWAF